VPIVTTGKKYFNIGSPAGSLGRNQNAFTTRKPEVMITTGGNLIADNQNLIQPS
jgi:hypothetical protein